MIQDLPAPREAPNILARAFGILFGRGYALAIIAIAFAVPWFLLRSWFAQTGLAHMLSQPEYVWPGRAVGTTLSVIDYALESISIAFVGLAAQQVIAGNPIDARQLAAALRAKWTTLLGVAILWFLGLQIVLTVFALPLGLNWPGAQQFYFRYPVYADGIGILESLVGLSAFWSVLSVALKGSTVLHAFADGVIGPWSLGFNSIMLALLFLATHFVHRWSRPLVSAALSHSPSSAFTTIAQGLVEALVVTFLTVLVTVVFLDEHNRRALPLQVKPVLGSVPEAG
jgi:hypothetical protein